MVYQNIDSSIGRYKSLFQKYKKKTNGDILKDIKIIVLDMDGVVNSDELIIEWCENKKSQLRKENGDNFSIDLDLIFEVRNLFNKEFSNGEELIFPELAERITRICNETDAYIVWSSTWRKLNRYRDNIEEAKNMFNKHGLPGDRLIGYTPIVGIRRECSCRSSEIKLWLKEHDDEFNVLKCAVIDDRIDAGYDLPDNAKYFNINEYIGIQEYNVKEIIEYLKGE